jgi:hypothetical protein
LFTYNQGLVFAAELHFPNKGAWSAIIEHEILAPAYTQSVITLSGVTNMVCTVLQSANAEGRCRSVVAGGYNVLPNYVRPAQFVKSTATAILAAFAGIQPIGPSASGLRNYWARTTTSLQDVLDDLAPYWWMDDTGTIQPLSRVPVPWFPRLDQILERDAAHHSVTLVEECWQIRPGDTVTVYGQLLTVEHATIFQMDDSARIELDVTQ